MSLDADDLHLHAAIAERLVPRLPAPERAAVQREQLFERVRRSAIAHREYLTVRREDGAWQADGHGQEARTLRQDATTRVEIVRLRQGATLTWPDGVTAQEVLVIEGALVDGGTGSPALADAAGPASDDCAYRVRHRAAPNAPWCAVGATTVYVRHLLVEVPELPALEAHWWRLGKPAAGWVYPGRRRWYQTAQGVDVLPLQGDSDVVSMLVRFAPGASVADHRHALDEDCLVLEGEMFLGDILLRSGDYQLAPAGGSHFGETSDVGVLFFFHGALDPVLRAKA